MAVVASGALTVAAIMWGGPEPDRASRAEVWGTVWAIMAYAATGCVQWISRHHGAATAPLTREQLAAATEYLATETASYWCEQARQLGITATSPVAVRWRAGPADLAGPVVDLRTARDAVARVAVPPGPSGPPGPTGPTGPAPSPPRPTSPPGTAGRALSDGVVTAWYDDLYVNLGPGDVLVVLGEPGSGKSGALLLLLLRALEQRDRLPPGPRADARVPVWVTCGSWDPTATTLPAHVADVLRRTYPGLTATAHGGQAGPAAQLEHGRVAVFLDGLDEMPDRLRPLALEAIQTQAGRVPVIVTSRTDEFRAARSTGAFHPAGTIDLLPVSPDAAAAFLQNQRQPEHRKAAWQLVIDHVRAAPDGPLGQVLATPLGLCLARDATPDPAGLIPTGPTTPRAVLTGLIGAYLDHAYPSSPDRRHRDRAVHWLSWTAHHLGAGRDLHWWDPPRWVPRWQVRLVRGLTVGLGGGLVAGLGFGLAGGPAIGLGYGCGIGPALGLVSGLAAVAGRHTTRRRTTCRQLCTVLTGCLLGGAAVGSGVALALGLAVGLTDGVALGVAIGFVAGVAGGVGVGQDGEPRRVVHRGLPRRQMRDVCAGATAGGLLGLGLGLVFRSADTLAARPAFGTVSVLAVGGAGFAVGLVRGLARAWGTPLTDSVVSCPALSYRIHRSTSALFATVFGSVVGIVAGVVFGSEYGLGTGVMLGAACGLPVVLMSGLTTGIVPGVTFAELTLLVRHRCRVRFLRLYQDALGRQVLRQAGIAYQFRHAALQDYLAAHYQANHGAGRHQHR